MPKNFLEVVTNNFNSTNIAALSSMVAAIFAFLTWKYITRKPFLEPRFSVKGANMSYLQLTPGEVKREVEIIAYNRSRKAAKYPHITLYFPADTNIIISVSGSYLNLYEETLPKVGAVRQIEWNPMHKQVVHGRSALSMGHLTFQLPNSFKGELPIPYRAHAEEMNTRRGKIRIVAK